MADETSFENLMQRLRGGDQEAATAIFRQFAHRLIALARGHLAPQFRTKVDPEDVVQSVFRSFFVRQREGQYAFTGWNDLWSLLALITLRKCGHRVEHYRASCRDVNREAAPPPSPQDSAASWEFIAREPTPSEAVMLLEVMEGIIKGLSARHRRIVELSLQGENTERISASIGCSERTVERVLERLRQHLEDTCTE
jgi:RNA polymerase sigma-70 factor (ECF subfamily)